MIRKVGKKRRLAFEGLEQRQLLAGNVSVGLDVNGNLLLTGDFQDNHVVVTRGFFSGTLIVTGGRSVSSDSSSATTLNGQAGALAFSTSGGMVLNMGEGNDRVMVTKVGLLGNVLGSLGQGNDVLAFQSDDLGPITFTKNNGSTPSFGKASVSGVLSVGGDDDNDTLSLYDATIAGNLTFFGGNGNDQFSSIGTDPDDNVVGGSVQLSPGGGDDTINVFRMAVGGNFRVDDGSAFTLTKVTLVSLRVNLDVLMNLSIQRDLVSLLGEDAADNRFQARTITINTGNGNDRVYVQRGIMLNLNVSTGAGNEVNGTSAGVLLTDLTVNNQLSLDTGSGQDFAFLNRVTADILQVRTQSGNDRVIANNTTAIDAVYDTLDGNDFVGLHESNYDTLNVLLGDDDDVLQARSLDVDVRATFNGGLGSNTYQDQGGNTYRRLTKVSL